MSGNKEKETNKLKDSHDSVGDVPDSAMSSNADFELHPLPAKQPAVVPTESEQPKSVRVEEPGGGHGYGTEEEKMTTDEVMRKLNTTREGLTTAEAQRRLLEAGPNMIEEHQQSVIIAFLLFMWNPLSWAMEVAAIISIILGDYVDFGLILGLLILNACIGFYEEHNAANAIAELKASLGLKADVKRDGEWQFIEAKDVVYGDVTRLKLGDVINADGKVFKIQGAVKIDQAALTGESFPVNKKEGDVVFSGSTVKQGDVEMFVTKTGSNTFYGKAAKLIEESDEEGHFQKVLRSIGFFCISFIIVFVFVELMVDFVGRKKPCTGVYQCYGLGNALVLIVGGVPIAMPTVLSVTMALGAYKLSKKQAIVSRLTAVEELAAMDILCSDKTGTLTLNKLTVDNPYCLKGHDPDDIIFDAVLASKRGGKGDAIEDSILAFCRDKTKLPQYEEVEFTPFEPDSKRATSKIKGPDGNYFHVTKGFPGYILNMSKNKAEIENEINDQVDDFGARGYRTLGVARDDGNGWIMSGLIPLSDPPRHDTRDTVLYCLKKGIKVKMITGDQQAIARETASRIGMGNNILDKKELHRHPEDSQELIDLIESADGFAGVLPETKFNIVKSLQSRGHTVGMTGDGANDAPALKRADIGIAVEGATGAARAAADIVLTSSGLAVISDAVFGSRTIFQRMKTYTIYAVTSTIRIVLTFFILTVAWDYYYPTIITVILAVCNDGTMMTLAKDRVLPSEMPDKWNLQIIFGVCVIIAVYLVASSIILFAVVHDGTAFSRWFGLRILDDEEIRGLIFMNVSITGLGAIFSVRSAKFMWTHRPGFLVMVAFLLSQTVATFIGVYGFNGYPGELRGFRGCGWGWGLFQWLYSLLWLLPIDFIKLSAFQVMGYVPAINIPGWQKVRRTLRKVSWGGATNRGSLAGSHYQLRPHQKGTYSKQHNNEIAAGEQRVSVQIHREAKH